MELNGSLNIYDKLPLEMILEIVKYLEYNDIKQLRLVCRQFEIILNDVFKKRTHFHLSRMIRSHKLSKNGKYRCTLIYETKKFSDIYMNYTDRSYKIIKNAPKSFNHFCDGIIDLYIFYWKKKKHFDLLCNWLKSLQNLKRFDFRLDLSVHTFEIDNIISVLFDRVDAIRFHNRLFIRFDVIEKIAIERISTITELDLHISHVFTDVNRNQHTRDSGIILLLKKLSKSLKKSKISFYSPVKNLLLSLSETELDLNSLTIDFCGLIDLNEFQKFAIRMKNLEYLNLNNSNISDEFIKIICTVMKKLKFLRIRSKNITNECINLVGNLELLELLSLTCNNRGNYDTTRRALPKINDNMKIIKLYGFWDDDPIIAICTNFPNLKRLYVFTHFRILPKSVLLIYDRLQKLRLLHLHFGRRFWTEEIFEFPPLKSVDSSIGKLCYLEDLFLIGTEIDVDKISRLKNLKYLSIEHCKATLSSVHQLTKTCHSLKVLNICDYAHALCIQQHKNKIKAIKRMCLAARIKFDFYTHKTFVFEDLEHCFPKGELPSDPEEQ